MPGGRLGGAPGVFAGAHGGGPDRRYEATREALGGRLALNLPALNVTVGQMLEALEAVAGPAARARVRFERDERIAGIVANWPRRASAVRAARLGLHPDGDFADIVRQYSADHPNAVV